MQSNYVRLLCGCGVVGLAVVYMLVVGVLHYTRPSDGVPSACRTPVSCNSLVLALLQQLRMQFPLTILFVCFSSHRRVTRVLELHATLSGSDYGWGVVGLKKPGRVRRIAQRAPASSLRDAATQRRSKPASHAARMGFASATS